VFPLLLPGWGGPTARRLQKFNANQKKYIRR
jgi:hypothetical protein